jgi:hypothetical protein
MPRQSAERADALFDAAMVRYCDAMPLFFFECRDDFSPPPMPLRKTLRRRATTPREPAFADARARPPRPRYVIAARCFSPADDMTPRQMPVCRDGAMLLPF